jgi:hypothetical protein
MEKGKGEEGRGGREEEEGREGGREGGRGSPYLAEEETKALFALSGLLKNVWEENGSF